MSAGSAQASGAMQVGFGPRFALVDDLEVVVEDGSNDRDHIGFDDPRPDVLGTSHTDVKDALESQVPFPHVHHVLAPAFFEDAYQTLDAAIDGENIPYPRRRGCEVCEVVERVDERQGGCAVEGAAVVEGGGDADRGLVGVGDAEVDFTHGGCCEVPSLMGWMGGIGAGRGAALVSHVVGCSMRRATGQREQKANGGCVYAESESRCWRVLADIGWWAGGLVRVWKRGGDEQISSRVGEVKLKGIRQAGGRGGRQADSTSMGAEQSRAEQRRARR